MSNIVYDKTKEYINGVIGEEREELKELREYAVLNRVPIVTPDTARLLEVLIELKRPENIIEVGCAIGYSSILMAMSYEGCKIKTLEISEDMVKTASENIKRLGLESRIEIIEGDAALTLPRLEGCYDLAFIDASKSHYEEFFESIIERLNDNALIISDNVLFKGMVCDDELVVKRNKTIVRRMRSYLERICNDKRLTTSVIPIGDGVALSYYRKEEFK